MREKRGESPSEPIADRAYSGKFLVRVPPEDAPRPRAQGRRGRRDPQPSGERAAGVGRRLNRARERGAALRIRGCAAYSG